MISVASIASKGDYICGETWDPGEQKGFSMSTGLNMYGIVTDVIPQSKLHKLDTNGFKFQLDPFSTQDAGK